LHSLPRSHSATPKGSRECAPFGQAARLKNNERFFDLKRWEETTLTMPSAGQTMISSHPMHCSPPISIAEQLTSFVHLLCAAVKGITINPDSRGRLIIVDRTGGSLILYITSICVAGITLVIILLLALTANQLSRLQQAAQKYGVVSTYHLDNRSKHDLNKMILPKINGFKYESSTSMPLVCSPEFLIDTIEFRNALLWARDWEVLRLIAIDEAHLYAMHGASFRDSIRQLK